MSADNDDLWETPDPADDFDDEDGGWVTHKDDANDLWDTTDDKPSDAPAEDTK